MAEKISMEALILEINEQVRVVKDCAQNEKQARRALTSASNRLSELQKQFDAQFAQWRKDAPRESAWGDTTGYKGEV
ncbi:hypothetical protein [Silvimonas sp.]|uniref:hypothetical protein n=1 Tax=Silvimonas sp. TaxID=2650811 RepID=UPI00283F8706|nr:hypothetical protein [Silvimonas sp.]MDR3427791.1 hypothetical protein [Silvimonas sp.]